MSECATKVRHRTKAEARRAALDTMAMWSEGRMVAYKCRHCHWFHVGHPNPPPPVTKSYLCWSCRHEVTRELDRFGAPVEWQVDTLAPHLCR